MSLKVPKVRKIKRKIRNPNKTKEEIIKEVMEANEPYFQELEKFLGKQQVDQLREVTRREAEEAFKDWKPGEEIEVELIQLD